MRTSIGGQALLNGVMMRCGNRVALATRKKDETVSVQAWQIRTKQGGKLSRFPLLRGIRSLLSAFAVMWGVLRRSLVTLWFMLFALGAIFGLFLASTWAIETFLPPLLQKAIPASNHETWIVVAELLLLLLLLFALPLLPPIRRLLRYHGAEHQAIHAYENGADLSVAHVRKQSRVHPRCGTTIAVSLLVVSFASLILIPSSWAVWLQETIFLAVLLLTVGLAYESMRYADKHHNKTAKILLFPSAVAQRFTTKEPTDAERECAIAALRAVTESPIETLPEKPKRDCCC